MLQRRESKQGEPTPARLLLLTLFRIRAIALPFLTILRKNRSLLALRLHRTTGQLPWNSGTRTMEEHGDGSTTKTELGSQSGAIWSQFSQNPSTPPRTEAGTRCCQSRSEKALTPHRRYGLPTAQRVKVRKSGIRIRNSRHSS